MLGSMTSYHGPVLIRTVFLNQLLHILRGGFLGTLVEAEIVSPYHGILINTDVGNPTTPFITVLGR